MILRSCSMSVERFTASELVLSPTPLLRSPFPLINSEHSPCSARVRRCALHEAPPDHPHRKDRGQMPVRFADCPKTSSAGERLNGYPRSASSRRKPCGFRAGSIRDNQPPQACGMSQCEEVPSDEQEKQTAQLTLWARPKFAVCSRMKKSQRPFMVMLSWKQCGRKMREDTQGRRPAASRGGGVVSFWTPLLR